MNGAEVDEVDEPLSGPQAVVCFEFEAYPEAKALDASALAELARTHGGWAQAARAIGGVSEGFVRQNARGARRRPRGSRN